MATRNELAKELRREGDPDAAREVAALRRPSWVDWALDRAADVDPDLTAAFADAADAMRLAQRDAVEGRAADVGATLRELRARVGELARRADRVLTGEGRASELPELVERLTAVAAGPLATARLRVGLFRAGDEEDQGPPPAVAVSARSAPAEPRAARAPRRGRTRTATPHDEPTVPDEPDEPDDAAARAAARRELVRAVAERERALRTAEHHVERAAHALDELTTKRELAAAAVARAQAELDRVDARVAAATATVDELRAAADAESARLAELRVRLDASAP